MELIGQCLSHHLFLFIGADPNTGWLNRCVDLDKKGFVVTGTNSHEGSNGQPVLTLETNQPGVFAIGDVHSGSTKRVAAAVGVGAAVVPQIRSHSSGSRWAISLALIFALPR